jgi:acyl-lipid omega-6 desaturase (Delta-12 desaturase)
MTDNPQSKTESASNHFRTVPQQMRRRWQALLAPFAAKQRTWLPVLWFCVDFFIFLAAIGCVMISGAWWIKLAAALIAAIWIARLFVIGHDACHGSYTPSTALNQWVGRIAFLPSLTPFSLWEVGHNLAHHGFTNLKGRDYVWTPFSPDEFASLPWLRRLMEHIYRSGFGQGVYYLIELWWKKLFFPTREHIGTSRPRYRWDSALVAGFAALWCAGVIAWALVSHQSMLLLWLLGFAVPFFLWNCLMGFVIYVQHTHPRVAWYARRDEWTANAGFATTTVHVKLKRPLDSLIHYILEHGAHHVNMGIPLYRLKEAQARLSATLDERLNSEVFTWRYYWNTVRRCKLYDFTQHVWLDFRGQVTAQPLISSR